ncbi:PadR family transcriptional regulator [Phormidium sp. CLA17]|uniref:PadR family transcriptional regulator n=1 Tax=Leptolyngbya sp. Cla-17 TaxID=2803751 RepID=UPI0017FFFD86|nr:PadR family transcriptional regulator [Leptolyngbya sp. Cla-17]MBM0740941.1 PadR family transcriptional regulator [Leptolyngbya sp. Cla-17]
MRRFWNDVAMPIWAEVGFEPVAVSDRFHHGRPRDRPFGRPYGRHRDEDFLGDRPDDTRVRRGDVKFILLELLSHHPSHGYDLIKEMETRQGGFRRLSPGSVYPTLQMLEEGGFLTSVPEGGKRIYTITDMGRQLLADRNQQDNGSPNPAREAAAGKSQAFTELRNTATELATVVAQVARSGDVEQMNRVRDLLDQVKRDIYAILAER